MDCIDITKTKLYIKEFLRVMKSRLHYHAKPLFTNGRASDGLIYVLSGSCAYTFEDGRRVTVKDGDLLYLAYLSSYRMDIITENYDVIWCDFFFDCADKRKNDAYTPAQGIDTEKLFRRIHKVYNSLQTDSFPECMSLLYQIYGVAISTNTAAYIAPDLKQKIQEIASYIQMNYHDPNLCVPILAQRAGVSEVYFRKLFHSYLGCSPTKYITRIRLANAEALMAYDFISLEECATQCGFSSSQYFSRVFKSAYKVSPAKYRKSIAKDKEKK